MKIVSKDFVRNGPGSIKMVPIDSDDLWYAYKLVSPGDSVMAVTVRKVLKESASGGRDVSERKTIELEIKVEEIADYDKVGSILRIRGRNIMANKYVKNGAFHTLELELNRSFVLRKNVWDTSALDVLQQASDSSANNSDLVVVLMQEGQAQILLVGESATTTRARIETSIPRKHGRAIVGHESAHNKFFDNVLQAFLKHVDFNVVRCAVIASSGSTKDQFRRHLLLEAERRKLRPIIDNKSKILLVNTTSDQKNSVREVLKAPNVMNMMKDTKGAQEVRVFGEYTSMLLKNPDRVIYGPKDVEFAHEHAAVQTLLITDDLFKNADIAVRQKNAELVESVKNLGGTVQIFSSSHVSVENLSKLTGIAAILRFPLPDLVV